MARTARDLITAAYRTSGVLSLAATPNANEASLGLQELNNLIETLENDGLFPYYQNVEDFTLVAGQATYTMGTGGDFNTSRPNRVSAVSVIVGSTSSPLKMVDPLTFANYSISSSTSSIPSIGVFRRTFPLAEIEFYPKPADAYPVKVMSDSVSGEYDLEDEVTLPRGYAPAIQWLLADVIADMSDLPNQQVKTRALSMLNTLEALNAMPSDLAPDASQSYSTNGVSDSFGAAIAGGGWL